MNFDKYIPWDKSWIIRMAILDLISGRSQIYDFLDKQTDLSDDLVSLRNALTAWHNGDVVNVGESGTLFRFLSFVNEMLGLHKTIKVQGTLVDRVSKMNPVVDLVGLSQAELLKVDSGTSQWASAKALMGDNERLRNVPYKLGLTYEAILDHKMRDRVGEDWEPRKDETIRKHANVIWNVKNGYMPNFGNLDDCHSEDYCMMRALGIITKEDGKLMWPSLKGHESDRLEEMEVAIEDFDKYDAVSTLDHRIIVGIVARALKMKRQLPVFSNVNAVNKSWPQFWKFIDYIWDFKEIYMEDVNEIGLEVTELVKGKLKEFGIELTPSQEDEIYIHLVEKIENITGWPDYRNYN